MTDRDEERPTTFSFGWGCDPSRSLPASNPSFDPPKSRQALDWLLAVHPFSSVHMRPKGIWFEPGEPRGWVQQRGGISYELILIRYEPKENLDEWLHYAISRSGRVYPVTDGIVERKEIWKP